jgi:hypothetical protein
MSAILLRTLTEKSCLKFGKFHDVPIFKLIDMGRTRYLRIIYFTNSMISFTPDILDKIYISENFRINKPGSDVDKLNKLQSIIYDNYSPMQKFKDINSAKKLSYAKLARSNRNNHQSKGQMKSYNQSDKY